MLIYADGKTREMNGEKLNEFLDSLNETDGVFETVRVRKGRPEFLDNHLERLREGAGHLEAGVPEVNFRSVIKTLAAKNNESDGLSRLRIILYPDGGGEFHCCVTLTPYKRPPKNGYSSGVSLITAMHPCCESELARIKCTRRSEYSRLRSMSNERGFFDCLLTDRRGVITETTVSSLFFIQDGKFYVPPIDCSRLEGIMENAVIEELRCAGAKVGEREYRSKDITAETGMFMTNSLIGVMPVKSINRTALKNPAARPEVASLIGKFSPWRK